MAAQQYRLREGIILRHEPGFFGEHFWAADPLLRSGQRLAREDFMLAEFLAVARSSKEMAAYRNEQPPDSPLTDPERLSSALSRLETQGIISCKKVAGQAHSVYRPQDNTHWRYRPASAPASIAASARMPENLLNRLVAECDQLRVLEVQLSCQREDWPILAALKNLVTLCSSLLIKSSPQALAAAPGKQLARLTRRRAGAVRAMLTAASDEEEALAAAGRMLRKNHISWLAAIGLESDFEPAQLIRMTERLITLGATEIQLILEPDKLAPNRAEAQARLTSLQAVWEAFPKQVRICARHMPIALPAVQLEPKVQTLLARFPTGCVVGELAGFGATVADSTGSWLPTEAGQWFDIELPPNCCQAGLTHLAVDEIGTVYPCEAAFGLPQLAMGNMKDNSLADIWASPCWQFFRGGWDLYQLQGCYWCKSYASCAGRRCRVHALRSLGKLFAPQPICLRSAGDIGLAEENLVALLGETWRELAAQGQSGGPERSG